MGQTLIRSMLILAKLKCPGFLISSRKQSDMQAYQQSMGELHRQIASHGGWAWQMTKGRGPGVRNTSKHGKCHRKLASVGFAALYV